MKYRITLSLVSIGLLLFGCTTQNVLIKNDGSAVVELFFNPDSESKKGEDVSDELDSLDYAELFNEFYSNSDIIEKFMVDSRGKGGYKISYVVTNIDSLGYYLDPFFGLPIETKMTTKYFEINGPNGKSNPEDDICGCTDMLKFELNLKFEKEIKRIKTKNDYVTQVSSKEVLLKTSVGHLNYNKIGNSIKIYFK